MSAKTDGVVPADIEDVVHRLRGWGEAYPVDIFRAYPTKAEVQR